LADIPTGPDFIQARDCFLSEGSSTAENEADRAEVILLTFSLVAQHLDHDWRDEGHLLDLEALNGSEEHLELELGQNDCLVAIVDTLIQVSSVRRGNRGEMALPQ
jgi:hypothetical protein